MAIVGNPRTRPAMLDPPKVVPLADLFFERDLAAKGGVLVVI